VAVQWLNQALCFYQSLCLVDSEELRNRHLRVAASRCVQVILKFVLLTEISQAKNKIKIYEYSRFKKFN